MEESAAPPEINFSASPGLSDDERVLLDQLGRGGIPRRDFIKLVTSTGAGVFGAQLLTEQRTYADAATFTESAAVPVALKSRMPLTLHITGTEHSLDLDPRVTLLDALR